MDVIDKHAKVLHEKGFFKTKLTERRKLMIKLLAQQILVQRLEATEPPEPQETQDFYDQALEYAIRVCKNMS